VVSADDGAAPSTRRALLSTSTGGVAAGALIVLAGCGHTSRRPDVHKIPPSARDADVMIINGLLDRCERTIAAYTATIPLFGGHLHASMKQFLDQDLDHAGELYRLIKQAGGDANKPQPSYNFGRPKGRKDLIELLHRLESEMVARYFTAIPQLSPGSVRAAIASILASDAQHATVLRLALSLDPLPTAFVTGTG
jgi:hypothetical protein